MGIFKPVWMNKNKDKALKAVEKTSDQESLIDIAKNAEKGVRFYAIKKITDQAFLTDTVKNDKDRDIRKVALAGLTGAAGLADVAKSDTYGDVFEAATEKLNDQNMLADVAKNAKIMNARVSAVKKLTDQATLTDIAENDSDNGVRFAAAIRLTDENTAQAVLLDLAKNATYCCVSAADRLKDRKLAQTIYADIVKNNSENEHARREAIERLNIQDVIVDAVINDKDYGVCEIAFNKLGGKNLAQETYVAIAANCCNDEVRKSAYKKLTDQKSLLSYALNDKASISTRKDAFGRVESPAQEALIQLIFNIPFVIETKDKSPMDIRAEERVYLWLINDAKDKLKDPVMRAKAESLLSELKSKFEANEALMWEQSRSRAYAELELENLIPGGKITRWQ